jgi:hypothetical protein
LFIYYLKGNTMTSSNLTSRAKSFLGNAPLSALTALAIWFAGAYSNSAAVMISSGILAFGRPLFYLMLLKLENSAGKPAKTRSLSSLNTSTVGIR